VEQQEDKFTTTFERFPKIAAKKWR